MDFCWDCLWVITHLLTSWLVLRPIYKPHAVTEWEMHPHYRNGW
jgi:hypothetical protein